MADYTAKDVQRLRLDAGVGMMDAKTALDETGGDFEKAYDLLRERGLAKAAKRAGREAAEGTIGVYVHIQNDRPVMGVVVELACETDFVAKSQEFRQVADDIALHISWANPQWTTRDEVDEAVLQKESDLIARQAQGEGKPDSIIPKIVEGRLEKFYEENVLYEQAFVNVEKFDGSVEDMVARLAARMGENIAVRRFARLAVGEGA